MSSSKPLSFIFDVFGYNLADTTANRQLSRLELMPLMNTYDIDAAILASGYIAAGAPAVGTVTNAIQSSNPSYTVTTSLANNTYFPGTILTTASKGSITPTGGAALSAGDLIVFPLNTTKVNRFSTNPVSIPVVPAPTGTLAGITDSLTIVNLDAGGSNVIVGVYSTQATGATNVQTLFCVNYMKQNYPNQAWILFINNPGNVTTSNISSIISVYGVEVTFPGISRIAGATVETSNMIISSGLELNTYPLVQTSTSNFQVTTTPDYIPFVVECTNISVATNRTVNFNSSNNYYAASLI